MHISYLMLCKTAIFSCLSWGSRMVLQVLASWLSAEQLYTWTHLSWWAVRAVRELSAASSLCAKYSILTVLHYESISFVSRPLHRPQYCSTIAATVYLYDDFILLKVESEVDMGILNVLLTYCCFKGTLCIVGEGIQTLYIIFEVKMQTYFFYNWINKQKKTLSTKWSYLLKVLLNSAVSEFSQAFQLDRPPF